MRDGSAKEINLLGLTEQAPVCREKEKNFQSVRHVNTIAFTVAVVVVVVVVIVIVVEEAIEMVVVVDQPQNLTRMSLLPPDPRSVT